MVARAGDRRGGAVGSTIGRALGRFCLLPGDQPGGSKGSGGEVTRAPGVADGERRVGEGLPVTRGEAGGRWEGRCLPAGEDGVREQGSRRWVVGDRPGRTGGGGGGIEGGFGWFPEAEGKGRGGGR